MFDKYVNSRGRRKQIGDDNNKWNQWGCIGEVMTERWRWVRRS